MQILSVLNWLAMIRKVRLRKTEKIFVKWGKYNTFMLMSFCPSYSLQAVIYSCKFHRWITVIWKGWDLDIIWKNPNFSFAVCHIILLFTALERSVRWYRAVSKGNRKTLQDFSFLRKNISLQHHCDFEIQESSRAYSKSHLKFLRNFTLLAYKGLHITSLQSFRSKCVSKHIRAACLYLTAFTMYTCSISGAPGAAGSPFTSSSVIMRKGGA